MPHLHEAIEQSGSATVELCFNIRYLYSKSVSRKRTSTPNNRICSSPVGDYIACSFPSNPVISNLFSQYAARKFALPPEPWRDEVFEDRLVENS